MAFTQSDLDKLEKAIASGTLQVSYQDKTVRYRTMDEMMRARELMLQELGTLKNPRRSYPVFSKGFDSCD